MIVKDWAGKRIIFAGRLKHRKKLEAELLKLGALVQKRITSRVTCLVAGPNSGSKLAMGRSLKVPVVNEEQIFKLLKGEPVDLLAFHKKKSTRPVEINQNLSALRDLLYEDPSYESWLGVCKNLNNFGVESLEMAVDYVNQNSDESWGGEFASFSNTFTREHSPWGVPSYFKTHISTQQHYPSTPKTPQMDYRAMPTKWQKELTRGEFSQKFEAVRVLGFQNVKINTTIARSCLSCRFLNRIEALYLSGRKLSKRWAEEFANCDTFPSLRHLDISGLNHMTHVGLEAICTSEKMSGLTYLGLNSIELHALPPLPTNLKSLDLSLVNLNWTSAALHEQLRSLQLRALSVSRCFDDERQFISLLESGALETLEVLDVSQNYSLNSRSHQLLHNLISEGHTPLKVLNIYNSSISVDKLVRLQELCNNRGISLIL